MAVSNVFETHQWTEDNECGVVSGWLPGRLHPRGRVLSRELGARRRADGIDAVFTSDLARAVETAEIAFGLRTPYPGGESWEQAVGRVAGMVDDLPGRWDGARVLIIGHVATKWGLDIRLRGESLEDLVASGFEWREGWEYLLEDAPGLGSATRARRDRA